jgi:hypothetical protein
MCQEPKAISSIAFARHVRTDKDVISWAKLYIGILQAQVIFDPQSCYHRDILRLNRGRELPVALTDTSSTSVIYRAEAVSASTGQQHTTHRRVLIEEIVLSNCMDRGTAGVLPAFANGSSFEIPKHFPACAASARGVRAGHWVRQ